LRAANIEQSADRAVKNLQKIVVSAALDVERAGVVSVLDADEGSGEPA
jgi:hypothetical protein